jgi:hypothetical protein
MTRRPDRLQATSRTLSRIASEPMTWLPLAPVAAAYAFIGTPWWICLPAAGVIGTGVIAWWKRRWGYLYDAARVENLRAWLTAENLELETAVQKLSERLDWRWLSSMQKRGADDSATKSSITAALGRKRVIESKIFEDGILTPDEEDLSRVLSDLWVNVRQELEQLAALSESARFRGEDREKAARESLDSIAAAFRTLADASEAVEELIDPLAALTRSNQPSAHQGIHRNIEQLRERMQQAEAIKRRVTESLGSTETPPAGRSEGPTAE